MPTPDEYREMAREDYAYQDRGETLKFPPDAQVFRAVDGAWVEALVWVGDERFTIEEEEA